jgi:adenine-specific DNA-methyltransferase
VAIRSLLSGWWVWPGVGIHIADGEAEHVIREPEQVRAFRDTWRDGIHCYLTYLREHRTDLPPA